MVVVVVEGCDPELPPPVVVVRGKVVVVWGTVVVVRGTVVGGDVDVGLEVLEDIGRLRVGKQTEDDGLLVLGQIGDALGDVSRHVLGTVVTDTEAAKILADIAREEDLNGRIRRNVHDTRRAVSFLTRGKFLNSEDLEELKANAKAWEAGMAVRLRYQGN